MKSTPESKNYLSELFGVGVPAISKHLSNIFDEGELDEEVVICILEITTRHGAMADKDSPITKDFCAMVQNKFHFSIKKGKRQQRK